MNKPIILSGIQPSGNLHLGNYLGSIANWLKLQNDHECFFCIVDHHAITATQDPQELHAKSLEIAAIYLASGIDPAKSTIFIQSHVSAHTELGWILGTLAKMSEMELMTQYKDKSAKNPKNINAGLFTYPILMSADILLYDADLVPVGEDQTQHLELARRLARRFNDHYGNTFKVPKQWTGEVGAKIMGLDDPRGKMSKSASSPDNYIALLDSPDMAREKIKQAVTDSGSEIKYAPESKPGISNLLVIYHLLSGIPIAELEKKFTGKNYTEFKKELGEVVAVFLEDFQKKFHAYQRDPIQKILKQGADKARSRANAKLASAKTKMGFVLPFP
ncbi:MAG: tryptophanyl-tRNA synthetase [Parcubacteria group bacterium Gr01-1014_18]|nr:MAG: tryptophanyl-tRNA synthetase [Parcubacteria group bacterium Greene0416_36]TSC81259.1 MAG: tryptophanyl-tRNA synthetase [Parcubacteria group bacterium Gr01-1014_18]TSC99281.1 MAG: tryptophanyl-tRNA synthetase [Parcubacteria group bacterium Greene1014_20]TSD06882.1 MAG: tryptophanyl-tRNA synthetase [Parcubacteria group bacterium Greene0714_2]